MVAYAEFVELSQSSDSEMRSKAAHIAALAYVEHDGPADEQAALYASLIGFLDDDSVKVRAALAYGLLYAKCAPRPIMMSLLHDEPIISHAVAQYSPVLVNADLHSLIKIASKKMLIVIAQREGLSQRLGEALIGMGVIVVTLKVMERNDVMLDGDVLHDIALKQGDNAKIRGALFAREELLAVTRIMLIKEISSVLTKSRLVKGSIVAHRLERMMMDIEHSALTGIGEKEAGNGSDEYVFSILQNDQINARIMLHALVNGHVIFFAQCLSLLAKVPQEKVFSFFNNASRASLNALFAKAGLGVAISNLFARLIFYARTADLADDLSARHFIVTAIIDELIIEHDGDIPLSLEEAFAYLNEQNIMLARRAARGVMNAFALDVGQDRVMLMPSENKVLALGAA